MSQDLILVVEDEWSQRRMYVEALKLAEYRVLSAETGEEALNLVKTHVPRIAILDVKLPGISGPEVCQRLRDRFGRSVTVIFYTEGARLPVLRQCMEAGGDDFLIKGASISTMLERVGYWLHAESRSLQGEQLQRARSGAPKGFGGTVKQKLYLLGYIAGAVNYVANSSMALKIRFLDYLKATLHACGVLELEEVDDLVDNWHEFYGQETFEAACRRAETDFQGWKANQKPPRGIVEFAYSVEAEEGEESG